VGGAELGDARHQPVGGEGDRRGDGEFAGAALAADVGGHVGDVLQAHRDGPVQPLAFAREAQAPRLAVEQGDAEMVLEELDLAADRGLGDVELLRRAGEIGVPGRGLEHHQGIGRRKRPPQCDCHERTELLCHARTTRASMISDGAASRPAMDQAA
jgi:hypothetical protein